MSLTDEVIFMVSQNLHVRNFYDCNADNGFN